ncbi:MAG: 23S rRNA pseudouridine(1911/1915/1917) synthase RluD [Betaproteobacteria bacterium]|jgi:23S rRNA pseudouridine1911/1915/1917 synthase|nr:23S rRNA pseudouridine(1911/1915/1917) synthase RluD [Betaproteobacteria bacterium]MDH5285573.1 23S rRNA pseudouridine(1911/1915/1917) synthase RluD [Betaproteobacteria bacterium]
MTGHYSRADEARSVEPAPRTFVVPAALAGCRLDQALAQLWPAHSRSRLKAWIDAGRVTLDGAVAAPRRKLAGGETLVVRPSEDAAPLRDAPEAIALAIVYEDDDILVVDKPAGLVVHPGAGNRAGTLLNALLHHAGATAALQRGGIVHRLDKDTSGLMVVAKTAEAQTSLVRQLASRTVARHYVALARGDLAKGVVVDAPIGRHPAQRTRMAVVERGKPARTHVDVIERFGAATLVRCRLETGRTHQIRVHLAAIGHPLVGDPVYGRSAAALPAELRAFRRQALHAERLELDHPRDGRRMAWTAPLPADFAALLSAVRREPGTAQPA